MVPVPVLPTLPPTMKALEVASYDGPSAARLVELPVPVPAPGQALVRVTAAGVNFADVMQSRGLYFGGPRAPYVAGIELAGEIVAWGPSPASPAPATSAAGAVLDTAAALPPGSRVMGFGARAFAEYVVLPGASLLPVPEGWSDTQAASFPVQWLTAHGCLRVVGRLVAGETVLVHAAAGGVGSAAVRLARHYGARVIATASTAEKLEAARRHGAHELINYVERDFLLEVRRLTGGRGVDLILEMVGGETFRKNLDAARAYGRIVVYGSASAEKAAVDNVRLIFHPVEVSGYHLSVMASRRPDLFAAQITEVRKLVTAGVAQPDEPRTLPLAEGPRALEEMATRRTTGKLVLVPSRPA